MRTSLRSACFAVLSLLLALLLAATASPAVAKGPTDVHVSGPGVDTAFGWTERGGDIDVGTLSEAALIGHHWDGSRLAPSPPLTAEQLGPRYVLTWTVGRSRWAVQHAYPFAEGGAWVHFLSLPVEGAGGWVRTPALRKQLVALGAGAEPSPAAVAVVEPAAPEAEPAESREDPGTPYDVLVPAGLLVAVVLGAGVLVRRRRLSR